MQETRKFTCRIEELPVIANFLLLSFERDQTDFQNYSASFDADFMESYRDSLDQVKSVSSPATLKAEQKHVTGRMYENIESMRSVLLKIEGYVRRAATFTVDRDNSGISELRKVISKKNIEGVLHFSRQLLGLLNDNSAALLEAGLTEGIIESFNELMQTIEADDILHQQKMSRHHELVNINVSICNKLWDQMYDLMDTGKRLYKYEQSYKLEDYTMSTLMKRVSRKGSPQATVVEVASAG